MPFSFIVLGISLIYSLVFFKQDARIQAHNIFFIISCLFGFLLPTVPIAGFNINIVFLLLLTILPPFLLKDQGGMIKVMTSVFIVGGLYFILTMYNNDNFTVFNSLLFIMLVFVVSLFFINNIKVGMAAIVLCYIASELINLVGLFSDMGIMNLFSAETVNNLFINLSAFVVLHVCTKTITQRRKLKNES